MKLMCILGNRVATIEIDDNRKNDPAALAKASESLARELLRKDKKTGEVDEYYLSNDPGYGVINARTGTFIGFDTLAELNEKFEDASEEKKYGGRVPKSGDAFWFIMCDGSINEGSWDGVEYDKERFESGVAFWTKDEAEKELARRKAYVILKEDTKGFVPNWNNSSEKKYLVGYDWDYNEIIADYCWKTQRAGGLYFATKEDAKASIKAHEKEWKMWLGVEE